MNLIISLQKKKFFFLQENQTFGIKEVKVSDKGQFRCVVENKAGQVEQNFHLEVLGYYIFHIHI